MISNLILLAKVYLGQPTEFPSLRTRHLNLAPGRRHSVQISASKVTIMIVIYRAPEVESKFWLQTKISSNRPIVKCSNAQSEDKQYADRKEIMKKYIPIQLFPRQDVEIEIVPDYLYSYYFKE